MVVVIVVGVVLVVRPRVYRGDPGLLLSLQRPRPAMSAPHPLHICAPSPLHLRRPGPSLDASGKKGKKGKGFSLPFLKLTWKKDFIRNIHQAAETKTLRSSVRLLVVSAISLILRFISFLSMIHFSFIRTFLSFHYRKIHPGWWLLNRLNEPKFLHRILGSWFLP